jgi:hypothetical protein
MNIYDYYITPQEYELAQSNGVCPRNVDWRIREKGWSKERALTTPSRMKKDYGDWPKIAKANGIKYSTFVGRVNYRGLTFEQAATLPPEEDEAKKAHAVHAYSHCRTYPLEILDLAKNNGIQYQTFRHRVKSGMSIYEAATKPVMTMREVGLSTKDQRQICLRV